MHQVFVPDEYTGTHPESSRQWRKGLYENPCENGKAKSLIPHSRAIGTMASDRLYCYSVWEIVSWTIEFHVLVITGTVFFCLFTYFINHIIILSWQPYIFTLQRRKTKFRDFKEFTNSIQPLGDSCRMQSKNCQRTDS